MANVRLSEGDDGGLTRIYLENDRILIEMTPSKGGDLLSIVDKSVESNILFEAPHNWQIPGEYTPSLATESDWLDYYPGGWQDCLPFGGQTADIKGASFGLHGESALLEWQFEISQTAGSNATVDLECELVRYPFSLHRTVSLAPEKPILSVDCEITNLGRTDLPYNWLQHICFGPPLIGAGTKLRLPQSTVTVEHEPQGESPLDWGSTFSWPMASDGTDLREVPALDAGIHDLSYLHDLEEGWYEIVNPQSDLGVRLEFDHLLFESLWLWRSFRGIRGYPFFGRETLLALEPATGWPAFNLSEHGDATDVGTFSWLGAGKTVETGLSLELLSDVAD